MPTIDDDPNVPVWNDRLAQDVAADLDGLEGRVEEAETYLPETIGDRENWDHVDVDKDGKVLEGLKKDGTVYIRKLESPAVLASTDIRLPQPAAAISGWDHVDVDKDGKVLEGLRTDGTRYFRSLEAPALAVLPAKIACYGDSMTGDHGGTGTSTASALAAVTGVEVHLGGVPGQTSTEAALRQGGLDVFITATGNSIPASGPVAVTVVQPTGIWKTGLAWNFAGSLAGVPGVLNKSTTDTWTFTRSVPGTAVVCNPETRWVAEGLTRSAWIQIFRAGKNGYYPAEIERDYQAASMGLAGNNNRFLALPIYNSTTEVSGSSGYNTLMAINATLAKNFGPRYYDLRGWLIRHGLAAAGITPTAADLDAISKDCIPTSLMYDNTHLTVTGRQIEAARIAHILTTKGWL